MRVLEDEGLKKDFDDLKCGDIIRLDRMYFIVSKDRSTMFLDSLNREGGIDYSDNLWYRHNTVSVKEYARYIKEKLLGYEVEIYSSEDYDLRLERR